MKKNQPIPEAFGKIPPQDIELEKAVLGALTLDPEAIYQVSVLLRPELFYDESNRLIYGAIEKLAFEQKKIDVLTIAEQLKKSGQYRKELGLLLVGITSKMSSAAHIEIHVRILNEKWIKRNLIQGGQKLVGDCYDESTDPFDVLAEAEKIISATNDHITGNDEKTLEQTVDEVVEVLYRKEVEPGKSDIISSGLAEIDQRLGGWAAPDLIIVGARPGMGKSTMSYTTIRNLCQKGVPVGMITLEVTRNQVIQKLISLVSNVPGWKFRKKQTIDEHEWARIKTAAAEIRNWPLYLDETCDTISKFRLKAASWKRKFGVQMIILDYLQLMSGGSKSFGNRDSDLGEVSRGLKKTCRELNIPIMALAQLSRKVEERGDKMPQLADLRESGSIEQDADNVLFLMRPEYYNFTEFPAMDSDNEVWDVHGLCVVNMAKNRHGDTGFFPLKFNGAISEFSNSVYTKIESGFAAKTPGSLLTQFENPQF